MLPPHPPPPEQKDTLGCLANGVYLAFCGHAACGWPFTRKHFGQLTFSTTGPIAMAIMYAYAISAPCREMRYFFAAWFALLLFHRSVTLTKRAQGWDTHSRDDGRPWLVWASFGRRMSEYTAKGMCEPLLFVAAGGLLSVAWPSLGLFVASIGGSLAVKTGFERSIHEAQVREWKDKEYEMRAMFDRYRNRH